MPLEIASWGCYAKLQKARKAYGLYDVKNARILRAYTAFAWEHAPEFPDLIHFPTYGRMEDGRFTPTRWGILEWTEETIGRLDREARERFVVVGSGAPSTTIDPTLLPEGSESHVQPSES
jgi:hypothetical protein